MKYGKLKMAILIIGLITIFSGCGSDDEDLDPTVEYSCNIAELRISPESATMSVGQSMQFYASPYDADGNRIINGPDVHYWTNSYVIQIRSNGMATASRTSSGYVTITASCTDCEGVEYRATSRVYAVSPN